MRDLSIINELADRIQLQVNSIGYDESLLNHWTDADGDEEDKAEDAQYKKMVQDRLQVAKVELNRLIDELVTQKIETLKELIYIEHLAGAFEEGLQICTLCGKVITDYTGSWASTDGKTPRGFPEGPVWLTGTNPVQTMAIKPEENYGGPDPYKRVIRKCTDITH